MNESMETEQDQDSTRTPKRVVSVQIIGISAPSFETPRGYSIDFAGRLATVRREAGYAMSVTSPVLTSRLFLHCRYKLRILGAET